MKYLRVSYGVRCQIHACLQINYSISKLSKLVGHHKSTIYRELNRNHDFSKGCYQPSVADSLAKRRYQRCRKKKAINLQNRRLIVKLLTDGLSPEQISGRLRKENGYGPSHQTIYNYVYWAGLKGYLRRNGKVGAGRTIQRRKLKQTGLRIKDRPSIANQRKRLGDWERDTMYALNRRQLLVCTERKSRYTKIAKVTKGTTFAVGKLTEKILSSTGKRIFTITNDNGAEFKGKAKMKIRTYFCDPLKPQQRGTVENTIGLLRQYVKRNTNIRGYTTKDLKELENKLNNRPRKILNYNTPYEVYHGKRVALAFLTQPGTFHLVRGNKSQRKPTKHSSAEELIPISRVFSMQLRISSRIFSKSR